MGYGEQTLFEGLDLPLARGERLAIMAPSGAGKSTLGNVLLGLQRPLRGRVLRQGGYAPHRWQKLYQDPVQAFASRVRLATQFDDQLRLHRLPRQPLIDYLARLGLDERLLTRLPSQVSGGGAATAVADPGPAAAPRAAVCRRAQFPARSPEPAADHRLPDGGAGGDRLRPAAGDP